MGNGDHASGRVDVPSGDFSVNNHKKRQSCILHNYCLPAREFLNICSTWFGKERFFLIHVLTLHPILTFTVRSVLEVVVSPFGRMDCQSCGMVGCWPTKHQCFPPTHTTGEPTFRMPRRGIRNVTRGLPPVPASGRRTTTRHGSAHCFFQTLGLPLEVMSQVEPKLVPPRPKEDSSEKAL